VRHFTISQQSHLQAAKSANQSGELKEKENETEINAILLSLERSYRQSKLNQRVLELLGFYVRLEQYYIDETIRPVLAIQLLSLRHLLIC